MEPKGLNNNVDYNNDYNIVYSSHLHKRKSKHILDFDKIEETVIRGKQFRNTRHPKVCKRLYFGKENITYFVIFVETKTHIRVITAWKRKGN